MILSTGNIRITAAIVPGTKQTYLIGKFARTQERGLQANETAFEYGKQ